MLAQGMAIEQAAFLIGRSVKTVKNWGHQYFTKGIECLNSFNYTPRIIRENPRHPIRLVTHLDVTLEDIKTFVTALSLVRPDSLSSS